MKGRVGFGILMVVSIIFLGICAASAATIFVDANNTSGVEDGTLENPFNTIQEGINAAIAQDTVRVASGSYSENLTISGKAIKLEGENPKNTAIFATSNGIRINGTFDAGYNLVEISGFTITGANYGIYANSATAEAKIHNNIIFSNNTGIYSDLDNCKVFVVNNVVNENALHGINIYRGIVTISNNIIINSGQYGVLESYGSVLVTFNNVWNNSSGSYGGDNISRISNISENPMFVNAVTGDYTLSAASPSIDAGQTLAAVNDPDGTRNDQGVYGGPGAAGFWPNPAGGPVVTELSVSPPSVPVGGTLTLQATGKIQ